MEKLIKSAQLGAVLQPRLHSTVPSKKEWSHGTLF